MFNKQDEEQKLNEDNNDHQSVCSDDNNPHANETTSQKQSIKDRKRPFHKMDKMHRDKMKSKHKHRHDSIKKPSSKGPRDKSGLYRGFYNKDKLPNSNSLLSTGNLDLKG